MTAISFTIEKKMKGALGRAGTITTPHGSIETPAFVTVGTKATVKALSPEQVRDAGAQVVLANTYHLYLQPGSDLVARAGGLHRFMNWDGPTMTDSGGFQAFSLGAAFGEHVSKVARGEDARSGAQLPSAQRSERGALARVTEDGVTFRSHIDGSTHLFTPESSIAIQHDLGADMIFAFDECTSPTASYEYQQEALERTHRWARRSLDAHHRDPHARKMQGLFGIVQGGRFEELRKKSARVIASLDFDGFGIGGSFVKEDMHTAVRWVNELLPEERPRHLLGIGEPIDILGAIENGCDLFDCVAPTRMGRNATIHTRHGRINITNARFTRDFTPLDEGCACYTCRNYTRAYVAHLFRAKEMFAATLATIHNLHFIIALTKRARHAILDGSFPALKNTILQEYYG